MSKVWISNSFSLNMIPDSLNVQITVKELTLSEAQSIASEAISAVGHSKTASLFSHLLKTEIKYQRLTIELADDDLLLVGQYRGTRLPEYQEERPSDTETKWVLVQFARIYSCP